MIDSETVTLPLLKVSVPRDRFAESVATVARGLSTRATVLVLGGIQLTASAEGARARRDRHGALAARDVEADVSGEGTSSSRAACCSTSPGRSRRPRSRSSTCAEESVVLITSGSASYRIHTYSAEDFPHLPELAGASLHAGRPRGAPEHDRTRQPSRPRGTRAARS